MARRTLIWHLGLPQAARPVVPGSLAAHADALDDLGRRVVATPDEAALATHELLGTHRAAGLRRKDAAGAWARIADRVWAHRGVSLLSTPDLAAADKDELRLALDPLIGIEVHLVLGVDPLAEQVYGAWVAELLAGQRLGLRKFSARVVDGLLGAPGGTPGGPAARFAAGHDLGAVVDRWGWTFHADRVHVVAGTGQQQWASVLDLAGLAEHAALPPVVAAYVDPAAASVLREVNRQVEEPLPATESSALLHGDELEPDEADPVPARDLKALAPVVARWARDLAEAGHDVRGDLGELLPERESVSLPGPRVRLHVAAEALAGVLAERAELRAQVRALEEEVATLDRKRRTWKRRAKDGASLEAVG